MIRINLLEVREERRKLAIRNLLVVAGLAWSVTFLVIYFWHQGLIGDLESAQAKIDREKQEINQLNKIVGEVEEIKGKKEGLESKLDVIRSLEANRAEIVDLLLALADVLIEEVWLDELTIENNTMNAKAYAVDMQSIGILMKKFKADPRFQNPRTSGIEVQATKAAGGGAGSLGHVQFELGVTFVPPQTPKGEAS